MTARSRPRFRSLAGALAALALAAAPVGAQAARPDSGGAQGRVFPSEREPVTAALARETFEAA